MDALVLMLKLRILMHPIIHISNHTAVQMFYIPDFSCDLWIRVSSCPQQLIFVCGPMLNVICCESGRLPLSLRLHFDCTYANWNRHSVFSLLYNFDEVSLLAYRVWLQYGTGMVLNLVLQILMHNRKFTGSNNNSLATIFAQSVSSNSCLKTKTICTRYREQKCVTITHAAWQQRGELSKLIFRYRITAY